MDNTVQEKEQLKANFQDTLKTVIKERMEQKENAVPSELIERDENGEIKILEPNLEPVIINRRPGNYYIKKAKNKLKKKQEKQGRKKNRH